MTPANASTASSPYAIARDRKKATPLMRLWSSIALARWCLVHQLGIWSGSRPDGDIFRRLMARTPRFEDLGPGFAHLRQERKRASGQGADRFAAATGIPPIFCRFVWTGHRPRRNLGGGGPFCGIRPGPSVNGRPVLDFGALLEKPSDGTAATAWEKSSYRTPGRHGGGLALDRRRRPLKRSSSGSPRPPASARWTNVSAAGKLCLMRTGWGTKFGKPPTRAPNTRTMYAQGTSSAAHRSGYQDGLIGSAGGGSVIRSSTRIRVSQSRCRHRTSSNGSSF